jgi:hypothetical protein
LRRVSIAFVVLMCVSFTAPCLAREKPILAVLDVQDRNRLLDKVLLENLTDYLRGLLAETGKYVVVDRGRQALATRDMVRKEKKESYKKCYSISCQVPLGRALAADKIMVVSIMKLGSHLAIKAEIIDLASEVSDAAATTRVAANPSKGRDDRIVEGLDKVVAKLSGFRKSTPVPTAYYRQPDRSKSPPTSMPVGGEALFSESDRILGTAREEERAWDKLQNIADNGNLSTETKLRAVTSFRGNLSAGSRYEARARVLASWLSGGPEFWKRKTEWFSLDMIVSNAGMGFTGTLFTFRWDRFYLGLLDGSFSGWDGLSTISWTLGVKMGVPLYLWDSAKQELRLGSGISPFMAVGKYSYDDSSGDDSSDGVIGFGVSPHVKYVYHIARHFSLRAGLELLLPVIPYDNDGYLVRFSGTLGFGF